MPRSTSARTPGITGSLLVALAACLSPAAAQDAPAGRGAGNQLARETSPYLLQHADDPVDWRPWGPEAFAKAKAEDKPIFLSIGYRACYWCHVMHRECFRDPEIARMLNAGFVCIKVDREERPDVDQVYMTALQAFSTGGWPMSMFLLPDGRPFYGGTYHPAHAKEGFTGFDTVLKGIAKSWREERPEMERAADGLTQIVRRKLGDGRPRRRAPLPTSLVADGLAALAERFDPEYGGFGYNRDNPRRPKFPEPVNLAFLIDQHRRGPAKRAGRDDPLAMALTTLDAMARGGIRDQLGGGYHRYATDRYWGSPHFEKMLYDNAQLASALVRAFETTADPRWKAEAEATFAFVARSLTAAEGGFFSSIDAESEAGEGAYYVWTRSEARKVVGDDPDAEAFLQVYGLKREPNFEGGRYVLTEPRARAEQAEALGLSAAELARRLEGPRAKLLAARGRRPAPACDDKVLTAWNGLMIAAYAEGGRVLKDASYLRAAEKAADFALERLREPSGRLLRTYRGGSAKLPAYLEDYAFLVHGLLRLHQAGGDPKRLEQARTLADRMIADFGDDAEGGFFFTADDHETLLARSKGPLDDALPSANAVAALDLLALHRATGEARYLDLAGRTLDAFSSFLTQDPASMPTMLTALAEYQDLRPTPPGGQP
ncbi:thioredoxin domain-containing protein [Paludisphaera mucosa]|uniref:Thioredoxin domain-containing protein n=1 Tax=Paludisphaera mucosa TaxID=3030827 RepID=A0ABT6F9F6_9BACT|nr:thioredoxin domain-containing protein [Paludisphaera mucosa]MDG3004224.1 thioredoxin domain-containing protein [Paludisphaera mucosa]